MSKQTKQPDEGSEGNRSHIPADLVEDVDDMLAEVQEYIRASLLKSPNSIPDRKSAIQELARKLERFASALQRQVNEAGDEFSFDGLAEKLLKESDSQTIELSLATIGQPHGQVLLDQHLSQLPFPHYESNRDDASMVVQILEDGTRTIGRFVNRKFVAAEND